MFDTHCHINIPPLLVNYESYIASAKEAGVKHLLTAGTDIESSKAAVRIADEYSRVYAAVGLYPTVDFSKLDIEKTLYQIEEMVNEKVVAIGEIGLDYYHFESSPDVQKTWLSAQIALAKKFERAVILHCRQAGVDMVSLLHNIWDDGMTKKIVFHCCEADNELLNFAMSHQIFIGVCGDITYDENKQNFIKKVPLDLLLVETDSPYLTPEPIRKSARFPNYPENLVHIVKFISDHLGINQEELITRTTKNAKQLFGIS